MSRSKPISDFDAKELRRAFGAYATGVTVVTTRHGHGAFVGLTVNSFTSVSLEPPLVLWSQSLRAPSLSAFREATHFVVNVLGEDQASISHHFAKAHPDKFATIPHTLSNRGAPIITGAIAHFECDTAFEYKGGDHAIFVGRVTHYAIEPGAPLIFWSDRYRRSEPLPAAAETGDPAGKSRAG